MSLHQRASHDRFFGFEADFVADLRCLPMAVRRKLDLAGVKLKLSHWQALGAVEREGAAGLARPAARDRGPAALAAATHGRPGRWSCPALAASPAGSPDQCGRR